MRWELILTDSAGNSYSWTGSFTDTPELKTSSSSRGRRNTQAEETHCKRGHPWTKENTYRTKQGYRACRACKRDKVAEGRANGKYTYNRKD